MRLAYGFPLVKPLGTRHQQRQDNATTCGNAVAGHRRPQFARMTDDMQSSLIGRQHASCGLDFGMRRPRTAQRRPRGRMVRITASAVRSGCITPVARTLIDNANQRETVR